MEGAPWYRRRKAQWIAAAVAAGVLGLSVFAILRKRAEDALFRRALSSDWTESEPARKEIEADVVGHSHRLSNMLESGDDDEVALAADTLIAVGLVDRGDEWLLRLSRTGTPYRRLRAAILLWWNGRHEERLREAAAEVLQGGDFHLELAFVNKLSHLSVDPVHERDAAGLILGVLDDLHREGRSLSEEDRRDVRWAGVAWAGIHSEYARPLLEARAAAPDAMPWHRETLKVLADQEGPVSQRVRDAVGKSK